MGRTRLTVLLAIAALAVAVLPAASLAEEGEDICPESAGPTAEVVIQAGCYYPVVNVGASPSTIQQGQSSTVGFTVSGGDPAQGCYKSGGWSGGIGLDGGGNASGSQVVTPAATTSYGVTCPASPSPASASATVTVEGSPPPPPPPGPPPPPPPSATWVDIDTPASGATVSGTTLLAGNYGNASAVDVSIDNGPWLSATKSGGNWALYVNTANYLNSNRQIHVRGLCVGCTDGHAYRTVYVLNWQNCCYPDGWSTEGDDGQWINSTYAGSGCKTVSGSRKGVALIFRNVLWRLNLSVTFCYSFPNITSASVNCFWNDVAGTIQTKPCVVSSSYYTWSGSNRGGFYAQGQGQLDNCVLKVGCWRSASPLVKIWVNSNGSWKKVTSG